VVAELEVGTIFREWWMTTAAVGVTEREYDSYDAVDEIPEPGCSMR
jgi:hypothetical protein